MSDAQLLPTANESELVPSSLQFPVVGLGASAGGVASLITFFEKMPADSGMAFVVVLHLSPKHTSNLPAVLQAVTRMEVVTVTEPVSIEPDHVYVIPPNKHLSMNDGYLRVTDMERPRGRPVAIDLFFRTLAIVHRERAVAVVLSGTGSDGAMGLTRVKGEGGITLAQSDAEFDGMPRAAVSTSAVDWELPVAEMPRKLVQMWLNARAIELPLARDEGSGGSQVAADSLPTPQVAKDGEEALRDILMLLRTRTGHDFRSYKRATVLRRLERRLQVHGLPNLPAYRAFLHTQVEEAQDLLRDLLIGVTHFFRDQEAFSTLQHEVIRRLFEHDAVRPEGLRAWVSGCATGEEAYSIAMLMCEQAAAQQQATRLHLFATDIDESAIAVARMGVYPRSIEADVSPMRLRRFFDKEDDQYRIRKEVREKVMFAAHDILRDPPFSKLDLISCRNLLIYLDREVHNEILEMFHFALKPGGYLFLGSSESADSASHLFSLVDKKHRIYRAKVTARSARFVPTLPLGSYPAQLPLGVEARPEKRAVTYADLHQRLAEQYAMPSVLIDGDANVVHLSENANRFLHHAGGAPSHHLLSLVQPELQLELRTAVFQAMRSGRSVEARSVQIRGDGQGDGRKRYVNMIVRPVQEPEVPGPLVLVLFDEVEDSMASDAQAPDAQGRDPLVAQLEEELRRTKEQLRGTIEHSETSTEELRASNEELQAINEELETSKEELQSINEELITVNHELKTKVEETGKINDDLQNLIASTDIATVFVDRAMSIKRYTPHATQLFNVIPTDVGRSLLDITHRLNYDLLADDAAEAFQSLRVIEREVTSQDGKWYLVRVLPYRTTEDRIDGAVLTFVDVTGRRQAEESMRLVAESTKDYAIITFDLEGRITTWNKGAERIFGYTDNEMIGQDASVLLLPEDRESGVLQEEMRLAARDGSSELERWHLRKDGNRIFCSGSMTPLHEDGRLQGYAKIARDLTGNKQVERQREAALHRETAGRAEAQAASDLKDEFLAVVSHELKNPLNLIQLNAELIGRLPEARTLPAVARAAEIIRKTVLTQAQIIDDLLDLSRMNTGKLSLRREPLDCLGTVHTIVEALAGEAADKQVELVVAASGAPMVIHADRSRIEQVVWNLLSNALKFTPHGGRVEVGLDTEGDHARLIVRDNGQGIAADFLPRLFHMFQQAEPGTMRRQGGLGIGLALVKHIVELHGGTVVAESAGLGQGSCFTVRLPLLHEEPTRAPAGSALEQVLRGQRVVVVDDDAESVETLRRLLELEGARVTAATGVQEALAAVRTQTPDLVITDIAMPGEDGYQLLQALRAAPATARLPVFALTGFGRAADTERAIAAGFDAHLKKPLTLERLVNTLAQMKGR